MGPSWLTEADERWLRSNFPELKVEALGLKGVVEFTACYDPTARKFLILGSPVEPPAGATTLSVKHEISIVDRTGVSTSRLPAVRIHSVTPTRDRHINVSDNSACLCSPLVEDEFLTPGLNFRLFYEELVLPFLFGQTYYTQMKRWPWGDFSHGAAGVMESYKQLSDPNHAERSLAVLRLDKNWLKIKKLLSQSLPIRGNAQCICEKKFRTRIGACHPIAHEGLEMLRAHIRRRGLQIP